MTLAAAACALLGVVHLALGVASHAERLPRNFFAGIRTTQMLRSDQAWIVGHRAAAPVFITIGIAGVVVAVVMAARSVSGDAATTYLLSYIALVLVGLAGAAWLAHRAVR